jgi:glycine betaine/proline transport system substrate-binding protein
MFAKTSSQQFIFIKVLAIFVIGLSACQASTHVTDNSPSLNQEMIRSAHSSWIKEHFQTAIVNIGLEKLGYRVDTPKELDYPALYVSIANETLDYSTVYYDPGHKHFFDNAGGNEKLARIGTLTPKSLQGYRIDRKNSEPVSALQPSTAQRSKAGKAI